MYNIFPFLGCLNLFFFSGCEQPAAGCKVHHPKKSSIKSSIHLNWLSSTLVSILLCLEFISSMLYFVRKTSLTPHRGFLLCLSVYSKICPGSRR